VQHLSTYTKLTQNINIHFPFTLKLTLTVYMAQNDRWPVKVFMLQFLSHVQRRSWQKIYIMMCTNGTNSNMKQWLHIMVQYWE